MMRGRSCPGGFSIYGDFVNAEYDRSFLEYLN